MRKQRVVQFIDLILIFNIVLFFSGARISWNEDKIISYSMLVLAIINVLFLYKTIRLRVHYNRQLAKEIEVESKAEALLDDEGKELYIKTKQNHLENIIEVKIKEAFPNYRILKDCYIPQSHGDYSQVDLIFIHKKGIFVIESKNLTGTITGDWQDAKLNVMHRGGKEYAMYNPLKQNDMHIKRLKDLLGRTSNQFYNVVVFGDTTYIDMPLRGIGYSARVSVTSKLIENIKTLMNRSSLDLSSGELQVIYDDLLNNVKGNKNKEKNHIDRINEKYPNNTL